MNVSRSHTIRSIISRSARETLRWRGIAGIASCALAVRLVMIGWCLWGHGCAPQSTLSGRYFEGGYAIAAGWGYINGSDAAHAALTPDQARVELGNAPRHPVQAPISFSPVAVHPPGMSLLIAGLQKIIGGDAVVPMMLFGAVLDMVATIVLYCMVRATWSPAAATLTGLVYAFFLPTAYASTAAGLPDGIIAFFLIVGMACVMWGIERAGRRRWVAFAAAGFSFGLSGYLRPEFVLMGIGLFPFLWYRLGRIRDAAALSVLTLALTFATLLPWAYRNDRTFGQWIFTSAAAGGTMLNGLGEFENPWELRALDADREKEAAAHGYASAWSPRASAYFMRVFERDVRENPRGYALSVLKRLPMIAAPALGFGYENPLRTSSFSLLRSRNTSDRYRVALSHPLYVLSAYWGPLLFATLSLTFLICSIALVIRERARRATALLVLAPYCYGVLVHTLTHLEPRFLLATMFPLMFGCGAYLAPHLPIRLFEPLARRGPDVRKDLVRQV